MNKIIKISADDPNKQIRNIFPVHLQGGSPWFGYIWIDDICFTIVKSKRSYRINKTVLGK